MCGIKWSMCLLVALRALDLRNAFKGHGVLHSHFLEGSFRSFITAFVGIFVEVELVILLANDSE